jgi:hypothetical protein
LPAAVLVSIGWSVARSVAPRALSVRTHSSMDLTDTAATDAVLVQEGSRREQGRDRP